MSSLPIDETRAELELDLEAGGFTVINDVDRGIRPPGVVIGTGNPYLTDGEMLNRDELQLALELFVVFRVAKGSTMVAEVDRAIQDVLLAIDDRWSFREASAPFRATNLQGLAASRIRISTNVRITEGV